MIELTFLKLLTDVNKTSESTECDICRYWYKGIGLNKGFNFPPNVCYGCHDLLMMHTKLSNGATLNIKSADYCCIFSRISKSEDKFNAKY